MNSTITSIDFEALEMKLFSQNSLTKNENTFEGSCIKELGTWYDYLLFRQQFPFKTRRN